MNCRFCIAFMGIFTSNEFKSAFSPDSMHFVDSLRWLVTISKAAAIKIHLIAEQKFSLRPERAYLFLYLVLLRTVFSVNLIPNRCVRSSCSHWLSVAYLT